MKTITENERKTPVIAEADVIVVGGGAGGIGAALAAGRSGVNTLLLEQANCLGGRSPDPVSESALYTG
jgi:glycerol-3-phosphate dehydrogenase